MTALSLVASIDVGQPPAFRSAADLVVVHATVTDANGRVVKNLGRDAFHLAEDGHQQTIAQFSRDPLPVSIAIALDTSASMRGQRFDFARAAIWQLLDRLTPEDEVSVRGFDDEPFAIAQWTHSRSAVVAAMSVIAPRPAFGYTALYSAVGDALADLLRARARRRAVLVVSDGNDEMAGDRFYRDDQHVLPRNLSAQTRLRELVGRVARSEALVYAIGVEDPKSRQLPLDAHALRSITDPTGGVTSIVEANADTPAAVGRVVDELRHQYLVGFVPAHDADERFHKLDVTVKGCVCRVRARSGYFHARTRP